MEKTFTMIKPNSVKDRNIGGIINIIEKNEFNIIDIKFVKLTKEMAISFYNEHKDKHWFNNLIDFMTSDYVVSMVLEKDNAIKDYRNLIGSSKIEGSIRYMYGKNSTENSVHGSDSSESANKEIKFHYTL